MIDFEKEVLDFSIKNNLLTEGDSVLTAVSGGPDSVALSLWLHSISNELNITISIFHLDHQVRKDSNKDSRFVADFAQRLGLQFFDFKHDVPAYAEKNDLSLQEAGRHLRYDLLSKTAAKISATKIATGHQANDQVETFFLRLLRGASLTGLQSIPLKRGNIIRPFLNTPKNDILAYLKSKKQRFLIDPSNIKPVYLRNRVRKELMPVLQQLNPSYLQVLANNIGLINEEEQMLDLIASELARTLLMRDEDFISLPTEEFAGLNGALKRRLIRQAIYYIKGDLRSIEQKHIQLIIDNYHDFGFTLELPKNLLFYVDYNYLRFGLSKAFKPVPIKKTSLKIGRSVELPEISSSIEAKIIKKCQSSQFVVCLDYDRIKPPLMVRGRQPGDYIKPLGMSGTKKLQDFFVDSKVPKFKRDSVAIVQDKEKIIWVAGFSIDDRVKVDNQTKRILRLRLR